MRNLDYNSKLIQLFSQVNSQSNINFIIFQYRQISFTKFIIYQLSLFIIGPFKQTFECQYDNIQHEKFVYRNQTIDFYSDKIGYILLQLQDDLQNLVIKSYSSNFIKIINKSNNNENKLNFYDVLPDFIKDAHPILVQKFVQTGQARFYRNLSLTFIQQDNGLAKQMEQSFDTTTLLHDNKIVFGAVIQDVMDQKAYLLVNVNGFLSGMTFMCLRKLGFTAEEISSVNSFYSFYEVEINQIVPNFTVQQLIETDFDEQKFDNKRFLFLDLSSNSIDIITKSTSLGNQQLSKIWQNNKLVKEYLVDLYIMKRNVFGFNYYIIEIESAYQIDYSQYSRNPQSLLQFKSKDESAVFDVDSLILSLQDDNYQEVPEFQKQESGKIIKEITNNLELQGILQNQQINPSDLNKSNLIEQQPQLVNSLLQFQQNSKKSKYVATIQYDSYNTKIECIVVTRLFLLWIKTTSISSQSPLASLGQNSSNKIRSQNQNQLDAILDLNSESSLNSSRKPSFIQRLESIERFYSSFNSSQQQVLLFVLLLTLIVCCIFSIFILSLLNADLLSKIRSIEMLSFQANILAPYDRYLGIKSQINYYQELYASNNISFQQQVDLVEPLYSIIDLCYNELKLNSYSSLLEKDLSEFFKDIYTDTFFMGTTDKLVYSRNITFREFIHQLLNYQYDYKNIFDKRIPTNGCPCQVFQFSNYLHFQEILEKMSQDILAFSINKCEQMINKWRIIWISFVIVCCLLCLLIYYLRLVLALQCDTIMEIVQFIFDFQTVTHIQETSLKREIETQKCLIQVIISDNDLINSYQLDQQTDKQQVETKTETLNFRKSKRKGLIRISKVKSILFSLIILGIYLIYSCIVILSSQNFLNLYLSTQQLYKLIHLRIVQYLFFIQILFLILIQIMTQRMHFTLKTDLSFRSGNLFVYREMFLQWENQTYLNKSDGQKLYCDIGLENKNNKIDKIQYEYNYNNTISQIMHKTLFKSILIWLLVLLQMVCLFLKTFFHYLNKYKIMIYYSQVFGQYCLKALDGSLLKGMLTTLTYINQAIINQQEMTNFTYRDQDIFFEVEGGQIVSRVFQNMNQELQDGIITRTESFNFQNKLLSIFFLLALFSICFYILLFYYNNIRQNLKMMKFSVFMIPYKDILQNDIFEKYLKQIEMKLGYQL